MDGLTRTNTHMHARRDCGLACTLMALQAAGIQCDYTQLRQLCPTTSIWTIDLAHLISRFGVHTSFCTITLGPNPAFVNESFYMSYIEVGVDCSGKGRDGKDSMSHMRRLFVPGSACVLFRLVMSIHGTFRHHQPTN